MVCSQYAACDSLQGANYSCHVAQIYVRLFAPTTIATESEGEAPVMLPETSSKSDVITLHIHASFSRGQSILGEICIVLG